MLEWKKLARSIRLEINGVECDVWTHHSVNGHYFLYSVIDRTSGVYMAAGSALTEDEACEAALEAAETGEAA